MDSETYMDSDDTTVDLRDSDKTYMDYLLSAAFEFRSVKPLVFQCPYIIYLPVISVPS